MPEEHYSFLRLFSLQHCLATACNLGDVLCVRSPLSPLGYFPMPAISAPRRKARVEATANGRTGELPRNIFLPLRRRRPFPKHRPVSLYLSFKGGFRRLFFLLFTRERGKSETQLAAVKQGGGGGEKGPFLLLLLSLQIRRRRSQGLLRGALYEFPTFLRGRKSEKAPNFDLFFGFFLSCAA